MDECTRFLENAKRLPRPRQLLNYFAQRMRQIQNEKLGENEAPQESIGGDPLLIFCRTCKSDGAEGTARGFFASPPEQIVMCANRLRSQAEIEETLVHEMVHAVDYCTRGIDLEVCEELACSEVRAAREAECSQDTYLKAFPMPEVARSYLHKRCTQIHSIQATSAMFPMDAERCVKKAFDRCFHDHVPFSDSSVDVPSTPPGE